MYRNTFMPSSPTPLPGRLLLALAAGVWIALPIALVYYLVHVAEGN